MKCPHCLVEFHPEVKYHHIGEDEGEDWCIEKYLCPQEKCRKLILYLVKGEDALVTAEGEFFGFNLVKKRFLIYPKGSNRPPAPPEVPEEFAEDYREACLVLNDSPKASAALSRRCLQHLLREKAGIKPGNLADEIDEVIKSGNLPSELSDAIDAIRNIGNFAAHPIKSKRTGEIVSVEPGEAEWTLDVLYYLFNHYFVQPAEWERKRKALNKKLKNAGKKPMKRKK